MSDIIKAITNRIMADHAAIEERALEKALKGGQYGVSTVHHGLQISAGVDRNVPYGNHFTFPSAESYERWIQNGCPS